MADSPRATIPKGQTECGRQPGPPAPGRSPRAVPECGVCTRTRLLLCTLAAGTGRIVPTARPRPLSLHPHGHRGHLQGLHAPKPHGRRTMPHVTAPASGSASPLLSACLVQRPSPSTGIQAGTTPSAQPGTQVPEWLRAAGDTSLRPSPHPRQKLGSSWGTMGSCRPCRG